jgi:hypothetical protein
MLTNRELASLIILAAFVVLSALVARAELKVIGKLVFASRITLLFGLYLVYAAAVVWLAAVIGVWHLSLLKDTVVVILSISFPLLFRSVEAASGAVLVRQTIAATLGIGAVLGLYVNLATLSLWGELGAQIVIIVVAAFGAYFKAKGRVVPSRVSATLLAIIGLAGIVYTTIWFVAEHERMGFVEVGLAAAMSVWLPMLLLPFVYVAAFYAALELIFVRLPYVSPVRPISLKVRLGILVGLRGSVRYAKSLLGTPLADVAQKTTYMDVSRAMRQFRTDTKAV